MSNLSKTYPVKSLRPSIREKVEERHWQLFEMRLKNPLINQSEETYTKANDYHIIGRFKSMIQLQTPVEPTRRWTQFSTELTDRSKERDRLVSLFRNVWRTNWNLPQTYEHSRKPPSQSFEEMVAVNERDRKVISSIRHR